MLCSTSCLKPSRFHSAAFFSHTVSIFEGRISTCWISMTLHWVEQMLMFLSLKKFSSWVHFDDSPDLTHFFCPPLWYLKPFPIGSFGCAELNIPHWFIYYSSIIILNTLIKQWRYSRLSKCYLIEQIQFWWLWRSNKYSRHFTATLLTTSHRPVHFLGAWVHSTKEEAALKVIESRQENH